MIIFFEFNILIKAIYLFCLYETVAATLNKYLKFQKVAVMCLLGGIFLSVLSLIDSILSFEQIFNMLVVLFIGIVVFKPKKFSKYLLIILTMLSYILFEWGFSYLLQVLLFRFCNITVKSLMAYYLLDLLFVSFFAFIIYVAFRISYQKRLIQTFVYDVEITIGRKTMLFKMLLDSGNSLIDDKTGKPVVVLSKKELEMRLDLSLNLNQFRRLAYQTLGGYCSNLFIVEVDSIFIRKDEEWKQVDAVVGVVEKEFKLYDGLLHTQTI